MDSFDEGVVKGQEQGTWGGAGRDSLPAMGPVLTQTY